MFLTCIITGTISIVTPFKAKEGPFLRDIVFNIAGVFWTFVTLWRGYIHLGESIGIITYHCLKFIIEVTNHDEISHCKKRRKH